MTVFLYCDLLQAPAVLSARLHGGPHHGAVLEVPPDCHGLQMPDGSRYGYAPLASEATGQAVFVHERSPLLSCLQ